MNETTEDSAVVFPVTLLNYQPEFKTLVPPIHFGIDELHWMYPENRQFYNFMLENVEDDDDRNVAEFIQVFNQATEDSLPLATRNILLNGIEKDPHLAQVLPITPANLPGLVTNNPTIAISILLYRMENEDVKELLDVLVEMDLSINTMEVVNRLANETVPNKSGESALARPYLYHYIANCISLCEKVTERQIQNRHARLLCVFLQSLFRNNVIQIQFTPEGLILQIERFCIDFSYIREAAALYRDIKQLESTEVASLETNFDKLTFEQKDESGNAGKEKNTCNNESSGGSTNSDKKAANNNENQQYQI